MRVWFLAFLWTASGCASLIGGSAAEAPAPSEAQAKAHEPVNPPAPQKDAKESELKVSRVWARMDELETELIRQKERMRLLERALVTGIMPDELTKGVEKEKASEQPHTDSPKPVAAPVAAAAPEAPAPVADPSAPVAAAPASTAAASEAALPPAKNLDEKSYEEKLSRAHALFSGDHWGQAIAAYGAIAQEFPESMTQGHPIYWIGLSWFHLKEYQLAEKTLTDFLNRYAASPLAPRAHFYLAKTEFQMGLVEKAVSRFRNVIRDFPADEAAKMAKMEISRLDQAL